MIFSGKWKDSCHLRYLSHSNLFLGKSNSEESHISIIDNKEIESLELIATKAIKLQNLDQITLEPVNFNQFQQEYPANFFSSVGGVILGLK
jgi:hypothetical protein